MLASLLDPDSGRLQEDVFVPTLCAKETMHFAARLRLPSSVTAPQREQRVDDVLQVMGLWRNRDTQAGSPASAALYIAAVPG